MHEEALLDQLNSAEYLYLRDLSEPRDNALRLIVDEAVANPAGVAPVLNVTPELKDILKNSVPIESTENCRTFEFYWRKYVAYLVTEEGVGSSGSYEEEVFTGKLLRQYSKSHFLDHLARDTGGHFRPLQHYKLICLNHLIDVASEEPPTICVIKGTA
jgi:hypothetical protein